MGRKAPKTESQKKLRHMGIAGKAGLPWAWAYDKQSELASINRCLIRLQWKELETLVRTGMYIFIGEQTNKP